ncbi:hypothetical protein LSCM1_03635 [Leishmania martiniquensis]|uniref:Uncharacterized protein n=1 Tax=Leishmania martiniquensis TaxID=1580590 RepID=A0A836KGU0_9TRYP|nr:hypothetical protein LSCM1_03635 [Leishmania martiniquensis]
MLRVSLARRVAAARGTSTQAPSSSSSLLDAVTSVFRSSRYLRHAPPRLYVTCAHDQGISPNGYGRHMTKVLDVSCEASPNAPPHTQSIYLLTSTSMSDVEFKDAAAQSQVLVGLPQVQSIDAVHRFCDMYALTLGGVHHILLPGDVSPLQSSLIKQLLEHIPKARLLCNGFGHALLTNATFHDGVQRAVLENAPSTPPELLRFAELPEDRVSAVVDGDRVAVDVAKETVGAPAPAATRTLRVVAVKSKGQQQRRRDHSQTHYPAHFTNEALFYYDDVFNALFVGGALHRLPWLSTVLTEASREVLLPMPPHLATRHPLSRPSPLLDPWRVSESCEGVVEALRRTPELERVLVSSYGELCGNVDDCIAALESSSDALEDLRNRLARRLATDTGRDVHRWSRALLKRIVYEVLCTQKASQPTSTEMHEAFLSWAQSDSEWSRLSMCLAHAAMALPLSAETTEAAGASSLATDSRTAPPSAPTAGATVAGESGAQRALEGAHGVELLVEVFNRKGLQGLTRTVQRETIDVQVFLAMSEEDLKKVFKATFGITKRLTLLQEELRRNL